MNENVCHISCRSKERADSLLPRDVNIYFMHFTFAPLVGNDQTLTFCRTAYILIVIVKAAQTSERVPG